MHIVFAFDRQSSRSYDADGRMRVKNCILSTAEINPYPGAEVPGYDRLGLDSNKIYDLYRDPDELARGAESFNGVPLMIKHVAQSAEDPQKEYIGGSIHSVRFDGKHLRGDLLVMDGKAIDLINSDKLSDLSCGYRYDPVMKPGEVNGKKYDGVMTNIQGNHVALVEDGRASNAHVADAAMKNVSPDQPKGAHTMALPEETGAPAPGSPQGEQNEQMNMAEIGTALKHIATILQDIHGRLPPQAAPAESSAAPGMDESEETAAEHERKGERDYTDREHEREGEERAMREGAADMELEPAVQGAEDNDLDARTVDLPAPNQQGTPLRGGSTPQPEIGAMDSKTVKNLINSAVAAERQRATDVATARAAVRHVLGDVVMDSADDIYREALKVRGVDVTNIPRGTERAVWDAVGSVEVAPQRRVEMAADSASTNPRAKGLLDLTSRINVL